MPERERARRLYELTLSEMDRVTAGTPEHVRRVGSLRIASDEAEWEDYLEQLRAVTADGLDAERYSGPEGRGLLFPHDGAFQPLARCRVARQAHGAGAHLFEHSPALTLSGHEVTTPNSPVRCRAVVAVDGRLETLLPELAGRVRTARLQMLATAPTDELSLPRPVYLRNGYEYTNTFRDYRTDASRSAASGTRAVTRSGSAAVYRRRGCRSGSSASSATISASRPPSPTAGPRRSGTRKTVCRCWGRCARNSGWSAATAGNVVGALLGRLAARLAVGARAPEAKFAT